MDCANWLSGLALGNEAHLLVLTDFNQVTEARLLARMLGSQHPGSKKAVGSDDSPFAVDDGGKHTSGGEPLTYRTLHAPDGGRNRIRCRCFGEAPKKQVVAHAN